jgi:hypothetical protein
VKVNRFSHQLLSEQHLTLWGVIVGSFTPISHQSLVQNVQDEMLIHQTIPFVESFLLAEMLLLCL